VTPSCMKLRCPADDAADPGAHVAIDLRTPIRVGPTLTALTRLKCPCGKGLVIDARPETRSVGGVA
jgi:hypothetical protein